MVGVIDGTHIRIREPKNNPNAYICRHYYPSINVCAVCDANYKFTYTSIRWPGSCHDSFILRQTSLWNKFEANERSGVILGDSGYPCRKWLMTPFRRPENAAEQSYNDALRKTRTVIECTFGHLKNRFRALHDELRVPPAKAPLLIAAAMILHNIAEDMKMPAFDELPMFAAVVDAEQQEHVNYENGFAMRRHIVNTYFT